MKKNLKINVTKKMGKRIDRRSRRHSFKAELRRQTKISEEALKQWAEDRVFYEDSSYRVEAYGSQIWLSPDEKEYAIEVYWEGYNYLIPDEEFDVYEDILNGSDIFYINVEEAINLGLVEQSTGFELYPY